jgi:hypothetical protein
LSRTSVKGWYFAIVENSNFDLFATVNATKTRRRKTFMVETEGALCRFLEFQEGPKTAWRAPFDSSFVVTVSGGQNAMIAKQKE